METEHKPDDGIETPRLYRIEIKGIDYISFFILDPYIYIYIQSILIFVRLISFTSRKLYALREACTVWEGIFTN